MNGKILGLSFLTAAALIFSSQSTAAVSSYVCNACTPQDGQQEALNGPVGDVYLFDMINKRLTHYNVTEKSGVFHASISTITSQQQSQFNQVQQLYNAEGTLNIGVSGNYIPPTQTPRTVISVNGAPVATSKTEKLPDLVRLSSSQVPSAFDLVNTPANQASAIAAWQNDNYWKSLGLDADGALATFCSYFSVTQALLPIPVNLTITVNFPDGSHAQYTWSITNNDWEYKYGASTDAVGNPIPESPTQAAGPNGRQNYVYPYTPSGVDSAGRQWNNLNSLGIKVTAPVVTEHNTWVITCVSAGGSTGCQTFYAD